MKGILLAGGAGTRLYPATLALSKQLLPIYDKPMVYYPLSILMLLGIREVLIVSSERDLPAYKRLLGDGRRIGVRFSYAEQAAPRGIAEALIIGGDFYKGERVALVLGDNFFHGSGLIGALRGALSRGGAVVFGYFVNNPCEYGVLEFSGDKVVSIEEKPARPKSNYAVPGLYFYPPDVCEIARDIPPSARGELEITDVNMHYIKNARLSAQLLGRGMAWMDTGTHAGMLEAANYVAAIQKRQGMFIACLEEIAANMGFIPRSRLFALAEDYQGTEYGQYLLRIATDG